MKKTSNLIERQAAIDALWKIRNERDSVYYTSAIHTAVDAIKELPSAQPDIEDQLRAAYAHGYTDAESHFHKLMEEQPEIIHCKDCINCSRDAIFDDYWCNGREVTAEHYCGYAERGQDG